ncbi:hypothetical protein [Methylocella sp.]|uniref:hypothetical protein n=1 Tax=Methylocella sp. TaxID=1978226 RepID=UPI0035B336CF
MKLTNSPLEAICWAEDYDRLVAVQQAKGGGPFLDWRLNSRTKAGEGPEYVRNVSERRGNAYVQVAWQMLDLWPEAGREVRHKDGNRLNLCRDNLETALKGSAARRAGILPPLPERPPEAAS